MAARVSPPSDEIEHFNYGWNILHCLALSMLDADSAGKGTVIRPDTVRSYAAEAGFVRADGSRSNTTSSASTGLVPQSP